MVKVRMEKVQVLSIPVGRKKEKKKNSYTLEAGRGKRKKGKKKLPPKWKQRKSEEGCGREGCNKQRAN